MAVIDISEAKLFTSLEGFLYRFATPELKNDGLHVIRGFVNDQTLPKNDNEFVIYTPLTFERRGTNREIWDKADDIVTFCEYVTTRWQIDCYSMSPVYANRRASTYELIARSNAGTDYFAPLGIDCQYAENVRDMTFVMDSGKNVARWSLELSLGFWKRVSVTWEYFTALRLDIKNVDVEFPPK